MVFIPHLSWKGGSVPSPETVHPGTEETEVNTIDNYTHHLYLEGHGKIQDPEFLFPTSVLLQHLDSFTQAQGRSGCFQFVCEIMTTLMPL